jgi:antitoxin component HigA of HigAB toxin-antitoxin module
MTTGACIGTPASEARIMTEKQHPPETDDVAAIEAFVADTQFRLHQLMKAKGVSRAELAERLGVSKARVSAMFGGNTNLTLQTIGHVLHALGERGVLSSPTIDARLRELKAEVAAAAAEQDTGRLVPTE